MASAAVSPEINLGPVFHSLGAMEFVNIFELERSLSVSFQSCSFVTVKSCVMLRSPLRLTDIGPRSIAAGGGNGALCSR